MKNKLFGLDMFGLKNLEGVSIYEEKEEKKIPEKSTKEKKEEPLTEESLIYGKKYECPVCDSTFTSKVIRSGKARLASVDLDLHQRYENGIDPNKYDVIACPVCGYASLPSYFGRLSSAQRKAIRENISMNYVAQPATDEKAPIGYEEAVSRYRLALVNTIVKHGKTSEKAYLCLKTAWCFRQEVETFDKEAANYLFRKYQNEKAEMEYLQDAYDGFMQARTGEEPPICGMDEMTLDSLLAALAVEVGDLDNGLRLVESIIRSRTANPRMKENARNIKDIIARKRLEKEKDGTSDSASGEE
ncbi:MAG: DUF2225 domain-containing protein [Lachnospiraceae bacterium]|nr:DUF2225 domain-containing protein [Lachnospiraceae bacterium]